MATAVNSIMVIDDDPVIRGIVRLCLLTANPNAQVHDYGFAGAALEDLSLLSPDIILLDLVMPVMDGYEALPMLRSGTNDETKIIISTATELSEQKKESLIRSGADGFLYKPYNPITLHRELDQYFGVNPKTQPVQLPATNNLALQRAFGARLRQIEALTSSYLLEISGSDVVQDRKTAALRERLHQLAGSAALFSGLNVAQAASNAEAALAAFYASPGSQQNRQRVLHALNELQSQIASARLQGGC